MAGVTISYKNNSIATMEGSSGTKILQTQGKYCEDNITINYIPENNGTSPSGSINISTNGTYDVTDKATAIVAIANNYKQFSITFNTQQTGEVYLNSIADNDIANHYTDNTFIVSVIRTTETSSAGFLCGVASNNNIRTNQTIYGSWARSTSSGVSWGNMSKAVSSASTRTACTITVTSTGLISIYGSSSVPIPAGTYLITCSW